MKKNLLAIAIAIIAATSVQADQVIYKTKGTATIIGRGIEQKMKPDFGYWVYDPDAKRLTAIVALTMHGKKIIQVVELDKLNVISVRGANGKHYTSIAKAESPSTQLPAAMCEGVYAIGQDDVISLDGNHTKIVPTSFKTLGFTHINFGGGHFVTNQSQGSAKLDLKSTQETNINKIDHASTVNMLVNNLKGKGYSENPRLLKSK
ncbi:MAG: hypothetical protein NTW41_12060 [Verrucomicrobia bacterium]|nr:hypothetical protein [Verrucomicrobiota bacterium]